MLRRQLLTFACLFATASINAATVHIVLDASVTMKRPLADHKERMTMASDLVTTLFSLVPPESDLNFGVRVFGSVHSMTSNEACLDTVLLNPIEPLANYENFEFLQVLTGRGGAPLTLAIEAAAHDLDGTTGPQLLIVITDGDDSCGGDLEGAVFELKQQYPELRLHFIGIGLNAETRKRLTTIAPTTRANSSRSMVQALIEAIGEDILLDKSPRPVSIKLIPSDLVDRYEKAELTSTVFPSTEVLEMTGGTLNGLVTSGVYTLKLSGQIPDLEISPIILRNDRDNTFVFTLPDFDQAKIEVINTHSKAGSEVEINSHNVPDGSWITLVAKEFEANTIRARIPVISIDEMIHLRTPPLPSYYEARLHLPLDETHSAIVTRAAVMALPPEAWIEIPEGLVPIEVELPARPGAKKHEIKISIIETLETNQGIQVMWQGPGMPGDFLSFVPAGSPPETILEVIPVSSSSVIDMWAPNDACEYELRYISPDVGVIVDRFAIRVIEPEAVLDAPESAIIASEIEIRWIGPDGFNDYITIVTPETPDGEYNIWRTTGTGNPLLIPTPNTPGIYEIRYMSGTEKRVLDRIPIEITGIEIALHGPETVKAGQRFSVHWVGPVTNDDFIVVAPVGSGAKHHLDFTYTSLGNPASLSAPFRGGDFEIRYISGTDGTVLFKVPLSVQ